MPQLMLRALCAAVIAALFSAPAIADTTPSPAPSVEPVSEIAHVVTADRSDETLAKVARTTFVVDKSEMLREGANTVADALESVPGVTLDRYGAFGSQTQLSIRGSSVAQVLVLLNGMPVAGTQLGGVDLDQFSTAGVERVEVVEGGGSTMYGSGSVGGVVNIITSSATPSSARISDGSFGQQTYAFESPYFAFSRTYAANNFALPDGSSRANDDGALTSGRVTFARRLGSIDAAFTGDLSSQNVGAPGNLGPFANLSTTARQTTVNRDARLTLSHETRNAKLSLEFGDSANSLGFACNYPVSSNDQGCPNSFNFTPPAIPTPYVEVLSDKRAMFALRNVVGSPRSRLIYGIDLTHGVARIDDGTDPYSVYGYAQTAAYAQQQWESAAGDQFYVGLRGERDGGLGGTLSPSLGTVIKLDHALMLRANVATAFDAPSAELLYYPGYANPNLAPERTAVGDITLAAPAVGGGVSVGWFFTSGSNLFESIAANNFVPQNVQHALIEGWTLAAATRPYHGYTASLNVTDLYRAQDLSTNLRLSGRGPVLASTLDVTYEAPLDSRFDGFGLSATTKGNQGAIDSSNPATNPLFVQPIGYTTIDGFLGYRIAPHATLTLRAFNLGNERYAHFSGYPLPGRAFAVELRTR